MGIADSALGHPCLARDGRWYNLGFILDLMIVFGGSKGAPMKMGSSDEEWPDNIYPTDVLRMSFVANDVVNLVVGLPIILGSMWLAHRGLLIGLLFWPGALFYGLYNYLVNLLGMHFNLMYPLCLGTVANGIALLYFVASGNNWLTTDFCYQEVGVFLWLTDGRGATQPSKQRLQADLWAIPLRFSRAYDQRL